MTLGTQLRAGGSIVIGVMYGQVAGDDSNATAPAAAAAQRASQCRQRLAGAGFAIRFKLCSHLKQLQIFDCLTIRCTQAFVFQIYYPHMLIGKVWWIYC